MIVGTLESQGILRRDERPWAVRTTHARGIVSDRMRDLAERSGITALAPIPHAAPDSLAAGMTSEQLMAEIERMRAADIARARRLH